MWILIKDVTSCIWEKLDLYSQNKGSFSSGFTLDYLSSDFPRCKIHKKIIFEILFVNSENICAKTEKMSDKKCFITIYLPNAFGFYGNNKRITKSQSKDIIGNYSKNIPQLIRIIAHEITHVFDPLFNNIYYTNYYANKYKALMTSLEKNTSAEHQKAIKQMYYDSLIEKRAFMSEFEALIRLFRNIKKTKKESILFVLIESEKSDFERYLKKNRFIEWQGIEKKIRDTVDLIYSDERFLFV